MALGAAVVAGLSANDAARQSAQAGTNVAVASTDRANADTFRQQVEYNATVFAVSQARAQVMLGRFGMVPADAETLAPAAILSRATAEANPTPYPVEVRRAAGTEMVEVPSGCFLMGSIIDSAAPVHQICFQDPYWIDRMEVSRAQYSVCVAAGTCGEAAANVYSTANDQPINNVSWEQALAYCRWRGARLPTEPEWEYAARGSASLIYPWGDQFVPEYLVYIGNSRFNPAPDGTRPPESSSWVGALDMSGNVWEWVSTAFASSDFTKTFAYPYDAADGREDLTNHEVSHVTRGGSFNDEQSNTRSAHRAWILPRDANEAYQLVGIRCAASEAKQPQAAG
jgi:formylglycine-generating enzyme required for sulfatase activity